MQKKKKLVLVILAKMTLDDYLLDINAQPYIFLFERQSGTFAWSEKTWLFGHGKFF